MVKLLSGYRVKKVVSGMAHITGGGLPGNLTRALHDGVAARVQLDSWDVPRLFRFLQAHGDVSEDEMFRVFNMGIGYVLIVRPTFAEAVMRKLRRFGEDPVRLGEIVPGSGEVSLA